MGNLSQAELVLGLIACFVLLVLLDQRCLLSTQSVAVLATISILGLISGLGLIVLQLTKEYGTAVSIIWNQL
jgi:hypothetical protein